MTPDLLRLTAVAMVLLLPLAYALARAPAISRADYIYNSDRTGLLQMIAGIICGNVGAGTFVALLLFTDASPVIGVSLAVAYGLGIVLCGVVAPRVHAASRKHGVHGLVELIAVTHGVRNPVLVWVPIAFVFLLRTAVQLMALAAILSAVAGFPPHWAIAVAALFTGAYTAVGGYRVALETDVFQAAIILTGFVVLAFGAAGPAPDVAGFFDLGPYRLPLLVGIWLFIPASAVLAIDNWQRMATARSAGVARRGFFLAAPICLACYLLLVAVALRIEPNADILAVLRGAVPEPLAWLVDLMLIAAIMSTVDTFVMPLATSFEHTRLRLAQLRVLVLGCFGVVALLGVFGGAILSGLIAAFSSLMVCLPAAIAGTTTGRGARWAAILSLNLGLIATLVFVAVDINTAALVGFAVSVAAYAAATRWLSLDPVVAPGRR